LLLFVLIVLFLCIALFIGQYAIAIGISLYELMSDNRCTKLLFYIVLCVMLTGALTSTLRKDPSMIHFLYICIEINDIIKWFSSKVAVCILQIFILVFIIDAYFCIQREKNMVYISVVLAWLSEF